MRDPLHPDPGAALAQNARLVQYEYLQTIAPNVEAIVTDGRNVALPPAGAAPARKE